MQYDLKDVFTKAHKMAKATVKAVGDYMIAFKIALKKVWKMAKVNVEKLEKKGWSRWTKAGYDRLYFNFDKSEYADIDRYNSGHFCSVLIEGEKVSNSFARKMMTVKCFIDLKTGEMHISGWDDFAEEAVKRLALKTMEA